MRFAVLALAIGFGLAARLCPVPGAHLFGDEFHSLRLVERGYGAVLTTYDVYGSGLGLPLLQTLLRDLIGPGHAAIRGPALLGGIGTLLLVPVLARRVVGRDAAVAATALVAANSALIFYSHFARAYALVACGGLCLWFLCQRVLAEPSGPGRLALCALGAAVLPWLHLTATGLVVALGAATGLALLRQPARRGDALRFAVALGLGLAVAAALHGLAWDSLRETVALRRDESYEGRFGALDVASVLAGSRAGGAGLLLLAAAGVALGLWRRGSARLPLAGALGGSAVAVVVATPVGDAYAYARYLLAAVPLACVAIGEGLAIAAEALPLPPAARGPAVVLAGALLAGLGLLVGPLGPGHAPEGPYANTYLSLRPLPAFDVPAPRTPAFYRRLAEDERPVRIVESPALVTRARHLYRNYFLQHGKSTWLAPFPVELEDVPGGPYVSLDRLAAGESVDADYLVLHRDVVREIADYWAFVYSTPEAREPGVLALMERHTALPVVAGKPPPDLEERLRAAWGPAVFRDARIAVYRLRGAPRPPRSRDR